MKKLTLAHLERASAILGRVPEKLNMTQFWKCNKCGSRGRVEFNYKTTASELLLAVHEQHESWAPACPWKETKIRMAKITDPKLKLPA